MALRGAPTRKCPGVRASMSSGSSDKKRPRVEAGLDFGEERCEFLEGELRFADGPSQVVLDGLHRCLPKTTEVWSGGRVEAPSYPVVGQTPDDCVGVPTGGLEEISELAVGADKVRAAVAVHGRAQSSTRHEPTESRQESLGGVVTGDLQMHRAGAETDEDHQEPLEGLVTAASRRSEPDGAREVNAGVLERSAWGDARLR